MVLEDHVEHSNIFRAVWPSSRYLSPKIRVFVDFLAEHLFPQAPPRQRKNGMGAPKTAATPKSPVNSAG